MSNLRVVRKASHYQFRRLRFTITDPAGSSFFETDMKVMKALYSWEYKGTHVKVVGNTYNMLLTWTDRRIDEDTCRSGQRGAFVDRASRRRGLHAGLG